MAIPELPPFDATAARNNMKQAQSITGTYLRKETEEILNSIKVASTAGRSSITTARTDDVIKQRLTTLGFTVQYNAGYDQRDPACLTISW
jgi:hypothetical protein